jgi:hypothetical protein
MLVTVVVLNHAVTDCAEAQTPVLPAAPTAVLPPAPATILLKSGIRIIGTFEDIENNEVQLRQSVLEERRIPVEGVLFIDFIGPGFNLDPDEAQLASGEGHVLVLADGSVWPGTLENVHRVGEGGARSIPDAPVEVVFRREDGIERVPLANVVRLYLGDADLTAYPGTVAPVP